MSYKHLERTRQAHSPPTSRCTIATSSGSTRCPPVSLERMYKHNDYHTYHHHQRSVLDRLVPDPLFQSQSIRLLTSLCSSEIVVRRRSFGTTIDYASAFLVCTFQRHAKQTTDQETEHVSFQVVLPWPLTSMDFASFRNVDSVNHLLLTRPHSQAPSKATHNHATRVRAQRFSLSRYVNR